MSKPTNILILGASGMLGRAVYTYLHGVYPRSTWGTVRGKHDTFLPFTAHEIAGLDEIYSKVGRLDYIINCIGILPGNKDEAEMRSINAAFPHKLARFAEKHQSKLIHVSTDAVFSPLEKEVFEDTPPSPIDIYGKSKLAGEPVSPKAITIRTSIIGFDSLQRKGLLEWAMKAPEVKGYTNQIWSGCTTLQFAKLSQFIIKNNDFDSIRKHSSFFHFSPLSRITKHDIIKTCLRLLHSKKNIETAKGIPVSRLLQTKYPNMLFLDQQKRTIKEALEELILFENKGLFVSPGFQRPLE